jgi:ABC-type nitrate/sulfonate/bicarbonate transport system substrate-binding protein
MVLLILGAGCKNEAPKVTVVEKVVVVGSQWYGHIPVWIGIENGIFRQHGFDVEWRFIGGSTDRLEAISAGEAQFASLGEIAMLKAMVQNNTRFYWVGSQDNAPGFEGLVAAKGIDSFKDLKGKKIGVPFNSSADITCKFLLEDNNLDPNKNKDENKDKIELINIKTSDVPTVFRAGYVDAAIIWEPYLSQLTAVKKDTIILGRDTDTKYHEDYKTMTGPDVLIISKSWVDEDPSRAKEFLRAYFESLKWVKENTNSAIEIVHGKYIQQDLRLIKENIITGNMDEKKFIWQDLEAQKQVMSDEGIFRQANFIADILYEANKPDFKKWVNLKILPFENTRE